MNTSFLVLGTTSGCGKSFTTTSLLRFFHSKGLRAAPFKAYNLSSNYHELGEGRKMSYSTYLQTLAAEVEPLPEMNPVYVRPAGRDMELYLNGELYYTGSYRNYASLFPAVKEAALADYQWLAEQYDVIVMEGSGSPAEINCYDRDLANRVMAESVRPFSILVGDIDPGGVFASLHGTLELMPPSERETVGGFIINRYSGDREVLREGIEFLEQRHGIPCLGVVPWLTESRFAPEDEASRSAYYARVEALTAESCDFDVLLR